MIDKKIQVIKKKELGKISKRLYDNLKELDIQFTPLKIDDDILFQANLNRVFFIGDKKFDYDVLFFPNEEIESLRIVSFFLKDNYDESKVNKINEKIHFFNEATLMGHLNLTVDKSKTEYKVSYKYGVSLRRDGDEMNPSELEEILFYLNFLIGQIVETINVKES